MACILLYFGSFNPIHNGHTSVARYAAEKGICDRMWFVVSPKNPLKESAELAPDADRLRMAEIAVSEQLKGLNVRVSDVEFGLPKPSYTIDTLRYLAGRYPGDTFALLGGADIMEEIERWKDYEELLRDYKIYVYPREGYSPGGYADRVTLLADAPRWDYSSTDVREALRDGRDAGGMLAPGVLQYIKERGLWRAEGDIETELARLDAMIAASPTAILYLERGKLYNRNGVFDKALNDFLKARELDPANTEAQSAITMLREIFAFHYVDYYNP